MDGDMDFEQGYPEKPADDGYRAAPASAEEPGTKVDLTVERLNNIERELSKLRAGMAANSQILEEYMEQLDSMKYQLTNQMKGYTKVSCRYTAELLRDFGSSKEPLTGRRNSNLVYALVIAGCIISVFNTILIVAILLYTVLK